MKFYAVYDRKTGNVLHTHMEIDVKGKHKEVPEQEILALLDPSISRDSVAITVLDKKPVHGKTFRIDPKTSHVKQD